MNKLLSLTLLALLGASCGKGLETVTVNSNPLEPVEFGADSSKAEKDDAFLQLVIGEIGPIESLDPLFAENSSELRIINLLYDGLVALDENGEIAPSLAIRWEVNADSTRYEFHLRPKVRFHDSKVFSGGAGRLLTANDVRFVFERMASVNVPNKTADRFKEIEGFSAYHHEQTYIKNPVKRVLDTISGINVMNDSTISFHLETPTPDFLMKLTHPSVSIYARESTMDAPPPIHLAAGTGPFYFIKKDVGRFILGVNKQYYNEQPDLDRLDIISGLSEKELFQRFAKNEIHILMEPGPALLSTVSDTAGTLSQSYNGSFELINTELTNDYHFYYNISSQVNLNRFLQELDTDVFQQISGIEEVELQIPMGDTTSADTSGTITFAHTEHPTEKYMINQFAQQATAKGYNVVLHPSYSISEKIQLSTREFQQALIVFSWNSSVFYLIQTDVSGIEINQEPWNLVLTNIQVEGLQ